MRQFGGDPKEGGTDQMQPQWYSFYKTKGPQSRTPAAQSTAKARALTLHSQCHGRSPLLNTLSQKQPISMSSHAWMQTAEWGVIKMCFSRRNEAPWVRSGKDSRVESLLDLPSVIYHSIWLTLILEGHAMKAWIKDFLYKRTQIWSQNNSLL